MKETTPAKNFLVVNAIKCKICKDIVFSRAQHDWKTCSCGQCFIDGGFDPAFGCGGNFESFQLILKNVSKKVLYVDWNERKNKYGLFKNGKLPKYVSMFKPHVDLSNTPDTSSEIVVDVSTHKIVGRTDFIKAFETNKLYNLRKANEARIQEWFGNKQIPLSYYGNEMAGECGEACNVIKKLDRETYDLVGSRSSKEELAEELADVVICADIIATKLGIDLLGQAVPAKFNKTSEKYNLKTRMEF